MRAVAVLERCGSVIAFIGVFAMVSATIPFSHGHYAAGVTRTNPSCGQCHAGSSPAVSAPMTVSPARSLTLGQRISITTAVSGGASTGGGFAADVNAGAFAAGTGTVLANGGLAITHDFGGSSATAWTYGYTAPATPGPIEIHTVVLSTDADGTAAGDQHGFHGFADGVVPALSTPIRLYANDPGVRPVGESCVGGYGNYPVLGGKDAPTVGNLNFALDLVGTATDTYAALIAGPTLRATPLDLSSWGIDGCKLYVVESICLTDCTYGSNPRLADGAVSFELPIPAVQGLRGQAFAAQAAVIDLSAPGRAISLTLTNAVEVTVR